ncbi:hypothetical protein MAFF211471_50470 (plasmid) [Ralstonia solanacearum]|nr:hypothetical protein MAFF211471_50470 [Ralstonia solanacearum]BCN02523.1 hypothetical protein RPSA_50590 [Ralstonia solanacearum]
MLTKIKATRPSRYELSHAQWERIEQRLPGKIGAPSRTAADNRMFINGVLWVLRSGGARWSDLPACYVQHKSAQKRFTRWATKGVWERVFQALTRDPRQRVLDDRQQPVWAHGATEKGAPDSPQGRSR